MHRDDLVILQHDASAAGTQARAAGRRAEGLAEVKP